ncbi:MAG: hypothetical protein ACYDCQ_10545 [Dehalococcoidia bacterium]
MWLLHVVLIQGQHGWVTGLVLWFVSAASGATFASLSGELWQLDALLVDLALAGAGGALTNAATGRLGSDPLALIYDVRFFWTVLGAVVFLCLTHDALHVYWTRHASDGRPTPLGLDARGGFLYLALWLTGWPSEPGLTEATYDGGLVLKLTADVLFYQGRAGPLAVAHAVLLLDGLSADLHDSTLTLRAEAGTSAAVRLHESLHFYRVAPHDAAVAIRDAIARSRQRQAE